MMTAILPPAMLGILGGGQLGRMFTVAAKTMGYRVTVLDPDPDAPAARFADMHLCAAFDDATALATLADTCAAITTEFENVNADAMRRLAEHTRVSPSGDCVAIAQDRIAEKSWISKAGLPTAPTLVVESAADLAGDLTAYLPGILKTARMGYDGKGQCRVRTADDVRTAYAGMGGCACVLEKMLDLKLEISAIVARTSRAQIAVFPVAENQHRDGILDVSLVPARIDAALADRARSMACQLAEALDYVGVLAVEFFVLQDNSLVVNEIAPRPHNSGHYTLDACLTDQYQQQVRTLCNLLPGRTDLLSPVVMANILGDCWPQQGEPHWDALVEAPNAHLHLYGKREARAGRKMGHFTVLSHSVEAALTQVEAIRETL
jgi:5-(carboxyamino)imidazole ribonucleotide synthase